jgi:hypothetical protein
MRKTVSILSALIILSFSACSQNTSENESLTLKIKVINFLPIGWGVKYRGIVTEVIDGNRQALADTIIFGIMASNTYGDLVTGDIRKITFRNSGEINKQPYLPAINGTVSKKNEIWLITEIKKTK